MLMASNLWLWGSRVKVLIGMVAKEVLFWMVMQCLLFKFRKVLMYLSSECVIFQMTKPCRL